MAGAGGAPAQIVNIEGLFTEPTFAGPGDKEGNFAVPEDWVNRVEALQRSQRWDNANCAAKAIGFLKGPAAVWFNKALVTYDPAGHAAASLDWPRFKQLFRDKYFERAEASDIAADWYTLQQKPTESVDAFFDRCAAAMAYYAELLPALPEDAAALAEFRRATIQVGVRNSVSAPDPNDPPVDPTTVVGAPIVAYLCAGFHAGAAAAMVNATKVRFTAIGVAVFANGLRNPTLVSKARMLLRQGKTPAEVRRAIIYEDKSAHKQATADISARPGTQARGGSSGRGNYNNNYNRNSNNTNTTGHNNNNTKSASTAVVSSDAAPVDAANIRTPGRGGARGGRGGRGGWRPPLDRSQPPRTACHYCPGQFHWMADCARAQAAQAASKSAAAIDFQQENE